MPAPDPRLFLITPPLLDESRRDALAALLKGGAVASVLLDFAPAEERALQRLAKGYAETVQTAGAAALAPAALDTRLVGRAGLDGVHVSGLPGLGAALAAMRPDKIVGVGALALRDDAMTAGEKEPDYLMFGEPAPDGFVRPLDWRVERVGWWAEIFNIPCVGYVAARQDIAALADAGADFLALGPWLFDAPDAGAILVEAAEALAGAGA
jgi:thiamine-phosphate pyrophosphorylase